MLDLKTNRLVLQTCFVLLGSAIFAQNAPAPEHWGDRFVAALQTADTLQQAAIVQEVFSPKTLEKVGVARLQGTVSRLRAEFDPLEYHHSEVMRSSASLGGVLHIYLRKRGGTMWRDIQIRLDPEPPFQLLSVVFVAEVSEPIALPNGDIEQQMTLDWLDQYVQKLVRETDLAGSALVAKGDRILFERHFGFADLARTQAVGPQTLFNLGSGNKMFTALAILKLQEMGKLRLTDKLRDWLPDFPTSERAEKITLRHLLTHTSGIGEFWRPETEAEMRRAASWHGFLPLVFQAGFQFEPAAEAGYSNSNFILLGAIVEKASGADYFEFIQKHIYDPAGMAQSGSFALDQSDRSLATPLSRAGEKDWKKASRGKRGSPAGGGYSNGRDILRFAKALKTNAFVAPETLREMTRPQTPGLKDDFGYGYGFIAQRHDGMGSYGHGGIALGVNFEFRYFPALDVTLVVFSNQDNGAYDDLRKNLTRLITGER